MPGVNSQPCLKIFEKRFYSKQFESENFVHFSWKVIKQRIPTVTPNNYYTFSLVLSVKRSPRVLYILFLTQMLNFYQIMEEQDSSITMRPPQWADIRLCWQEVAKIKIFFTDQIYIMKCFLKKLNDLSRVSIAGAGLCWQ